MCLRLFVLDNFTRSYRSPAWPERVIRFYDRFVAVKLEGLASVTKMPREIALNLNVRNPTATIQD